LAAFFATATLPPVSSTMLGCIVRLSNCLRAFHKTCGYSSQFSSACRTLSNSSCHAIARCMRR
jgi:hypothetical protein